jgi:hypothetical protein
MPDQDADPPDAPEPALTPSCHVHKTEPALNSN